jgi:enoyl-CoA hydratase
MSATVTTTIDGQVAVVRLDDGKMNALSHEVIGQLHAALDQAEERATAVCIVGNDRALSAGFDLSVMTSGSDAARGLTTAGAELLMRLYGHPQPTVVAVTGHALAAGALLVLACDTRIAADKPDKPSKIGLNEVAIGMALPVFAIELARDRLSKRYATPALLQAQIFDPATALAAGYVDEVVAAGDCVNTAIAQAQRLGSLRAGAYATTKRSMRHATIDYIRDTLTADMETLLPPS